MNKEQYRNVPDELKQLKQWVCFKLAEEKDAKTNEVKIRKKPVSPITGRGAEADNPKTWGTFEDALQARKRLQLDGIGFELGLSGIAGIDIDHCIDADGKLDADAAKIVAALDSYTEYSPSRTGLHLFVRCDFSVGKKFGKLEVYRPRARTPEEKAKIYNANQNQPPEKRKNYASAADVGDVERGRYLTVTGEVYGEIKPIQERSEVLRKLIAERTQTGNKPTVTGRGKPSSSSVQEILARAMHAKNGDNFRKLWNGDTRGSTNSKTGEDGDHSAADLALCNHLAYWTNGDAAQIDEMFRQSGLMRPKWDERHSAGKTYGEMTIDKALSNFNPYSPAQPDGTQGATIRQAKEIPAPDALDRYKKAIYDASELPGTEIKPPPFIVDDILPAGFAILAAPPKTGKSWLALDLCTCVTQGTPFLGHNVSKGETFYLDLESAQWRVKDRFAKMGVLNPPKGMAITHNAPALDNGLLLRLLKDWTEHQAMPKLIVIDTIARIKGVSKRGENSYENDTRQFKELQQFAMQHSLSIVGITHLRKNASIDGSADPFEAITGSNAQFGVADVGWLIGGARDDEDRTFIASGRDFEESKTMIRFHTDAMRWISSGTAEEYAAKKSLAEYQDNAIRMTILSVLKGSAEPEYGIFTGRDGWRAWRVTVQNLLDDCIRMGYEPESINPILASKYIRQNAKAMFQNDGIIVEFPSSSAKVRSFMFKKRDK